jgi:hypothetical protein
MKRSESAALIGSSIAAFILIVNRDPESGEDLVTLLREKARTRAELVIHA